MKKVIFLVLLLCFVACKKETLSDRQKLRNSTTKEAYFKVGKSANRVRIVVESDMVEGSLNVVLLDAKKRLMLQESYSERFRFSRVYENPSEGEWYVRAKYENSKGAYKIKVYVE